MSFELLDDILLESEDNLSEGMKERYQKGQLDAANGAIEGLKANQAKCKDDKCKEKYQKEIDKAKEDLEKMKEKFGMKENTDPENKEEQLSEEVKSDENKEDTPLSEENTENNNEGDPISEEVVEDEVDYMESLVEAMENVLYSDLDQLIENSMRTSLRTLITESAIPPETKVDQLSIVERAIFTKEQMEKFVTENIHPILDCAGVFQGTYNLGGDSPIAISLPVYEAALILHVANEGLLESLKEDEKPVIKNSLYESMMETQKQEEVDKQKSMEIVNEHLALLYSKYEIEDDSDREALFNEAVHVINKYGISNLRPSFYELAECVCEYNKKAEIEGEKLFGDMLPETPELSESDNVFVSALNRTKIKLEGLLPQSLKDRFKNVSEFKTVKEDGNTISIANTATGISAMVELRESMSKCGEIECLQSVSDKTIGNIKAQSNTCKNVASTKVCEVCNKKLEEKWELCLNELTKAGRKVVAGAIGAVGGAVYGNVLGRLTKQYRDMKTKLGELKDKKNKTENPEEKEKIQKDIDELNTKMKKFKLKMTAAGSAGGAIGSAIGTK